MPDCDYCGEEFISEDAYLDHLVEQHQSVLTAVDQHRVGQRSEGRSRRVKIVAGVVIAVCVAALVAFVAVFVFGDTGPVALGAGIEGLPDEGNPSLLTDVESPPNEGFEEVEPGSEVRYDAMPPTSGQHYPAPGEAGFYENRREAPPLGNLVRSIEKGHVVIYYSPGTIDDDAEDHLRSLTSEFTDEWASVIAVPLPLRGNIGSDTEYVVTAWDHKLTMYEYDADTVMAFLAEYLGRGPENQVR